MTRLVAKVFLDEPSEDLGDLTDPCPISFQPQQTARLRSLRLLTPSPCCLSESDDRGGFGMKGGVERWREDEMTEPKRG